MMGVEFDYPFEGVDLLTWVIQGLAEQTPGFLVGWVFAEYLGKEVDPLCALLPIN
jgi:hypothetical protein